MVITRKIADYVVSTQLEDFPPDAVHAAKGAIMDCLGCALAGSQESLADILSEFVLANGGGQSASVIGRGFKASPAAAAPGWSQHIFHSWLFPGWYQYSSGSPGIVRNRIQ